VSVNIVVAGQPPKKDTEDKDKTKEKPESVESQQQQAQQQEPVAEPAQPMTVSGLYLVTFLQYFDTVGWVVWSV